MPYRTPPKEQIMEEFLTRRFSMTDVAWALQTCFASEFFRSEDKVVTLMDMRLFDICSDDDSKQKDKSVCLMKDGKYNEDRRVEVTWARVDPKTGK